MKLCTESVRFWKHGNRLSTSRSTKYISRRKRIRFPVMKEEYDSKRRYSSFFLRWLIYLIDFVVDNQFSIKKQYIFYFFSTITNNFFGEHAGKSRFS